MSEGLLLGVFCFLSSQTRSSNLLADRHKDPESEMRRPLFRVEPVAPFWISFARVQISWLHVLPALGGAQPTGLTFLFLFFVGFSWFFVTFSRDRKRTAQFR